MIVLNTETKRKYPKRPQTEKDRVRNREHYRKNGDGLLANQKIRQKKLYREKREEIIGKQRLRRVKHKKTKLTCDNEYNESSVCLNDNKLYLDTTLALTEQLESIVDQL